VSDLIPCPFCGAEPVFACGKVGCRNASCPVQPKIMAWYTKSAWRMAYSDWNRRTPPLSAPVLKKERGGE
jgi:hypothetical protein